jgi:hypothetical protein
VAFLVKQIQIIEASLNPNGLDFSESTRTVASECSKRPFQTRASNCSTNSRIRYMNHLWILIFIACGGSYLCFLVPPPASHLQTVHQASTQALRAWIQRYYTTCHHQHLNIPGPCLGPWHFWPPPLFTRDQSRSQQRKIKPSLCLLCFHATRSVMSLMNTVQSVC